MADGYLPKGTPTQAARYLHGQRLDPLMPQEIEAARASERARQAWDPSYISADEAATIPQEVLDSNPMLRADVERSMQTWPERRMAASTLIGENLPGGEGEVAMRPHTDAAGYFKQPKPVPTE